MHNGDVQAIKAAAAKTVPIVERHIAMAHKIMASRGA